MKEYWIETEPVEFIAITRLDMNVEPGSHGRAVMEGYIEDEKEEEYLNLLQSKTWMTIRAANNKREREVLFWGLITEAYITEENDQKKMSLELKTGTFLMDVTVHKRTFQEKERTYGDIFHQLLGSYEKSGFFSTLPLSQPIGQLLVQYEETDWEFLKRLASMLGGVLAPNIRTKGVQFFAGLPKGEVRQIKEDGTYRIRREIGKYWEKRKEGLLDAREEEFITYERKGRESLSIGDSFVFQGRKCTIFSMKSHYHQGELLHTYYGDTKKEKREGRMYIEKIAGCSMKGVVKKVEGDQVQVEVKEDENKGGRRTIWFPYATPYSTVDGTGWYCMPEEGDEVRLHFPTKREEDAYVISAVHLETNSNDRSNPEHKILKTKHGKEIRFTPQSIIMTNNKGMKIQMTDGKGISIESDGSIHIGAKGDIRIQSADSSIVIGADSSLTLAQGGTSIQLDKDIQFQGGQLRIQ